MNDFNAIGPCQGGTYHCWHQMPTHPTAAAPMFPMSKCCHCGIVLQNFAPVPAHVMHGPYEPR